jgi:hypothetical protein
MAADLLKRRSVRETFYPIHLTTMKLAISAAVFLNNIHWILRALMNGSRRRTETPTPHLTKDMPRSDSGGAMIFGTPSCLVNMGMWIERMEENKARKGV